MRSILQFLFRIRVFLLFLGLEVVSFVLLINHNRYQQSAFFTSANGLISGLYSTSNNVVEFFKLRSTNANLAEENAVLQNRINELENELYRQREQNLGNTAAHTPAENELTYITAKVINNTTTRLNNYITINKGSRDGIRPDMGVVSSDGAVGIVKNVSDKFAVVIPILNPQFKLSCKIKSSNYSGPLVWHGSDYRYANLEDIARHVPVSAGDTILTSGLTSVFPEGIAVGVVESEHLGDGDNFYDIKVALNVNFRTLTYVQVICNHNLPEQQALEAEAKNNSHD